MHFKNEVAFSLRHENITFVKLFRFVASRISVLPEKKRNDDLNFYFHTHYYIYLKKKERSSTELSQGNPQLLQTGAFRMTHATLDEFCEEVTPLSDLQQHA